MEKYIATPVKREWELFFKSPSEPQSLKKRVFGKTLNQLHQWLGKWHSSEQVVIDQKRNKEIPITQNLSERIQVPEEVICGILEELKSFEREKGYLDNNLDLPKLAKTIGTNHSYLSRVINHVKGKSFKKYLNDMRIEHAYIDLQTNPRKRLFTVEAIAFDNGFRSAESFAKKFKSRYNLYPSEFLKKLKSLEEKQKLL